MTHGAPAARWIAAASIAAVAAVVAADTAEALEYRVRAGDTLGRIAQRFGVSVADLKLANGLTSDLIVVGDVLEIPTAEEEAATVHVVRSGESLWQIALRYRIATSDLMRANGLRDDVIHPGQRLTIPGAGGEAATTTTTGPGGSARNEPLRGVSAADLEVLARIVKGECPGNMPYDGMVAVAAVVLNRVKDARFPNTIPGVAHQPMQFSCYNRNMRNRLYWGAIPQYAWDAARDAVNGRDPSGGATHYFNPYLVRPAWARNMRFIKRIGATRDTTHDFYRW